MLPITFSRTQWPMGHGGFHTGYVQCKSNKPFSYFFDCGGQNSKLIDKCFKENEYEFGALSHLHRDHISRLGKARVNKVFLPYMTPLDWLYLVATQFCADNSGSRSIAEFFRTIETLRKAGKIIWVRADGLGPSYPRHRASHPEIFERGLTPAFSSEVLSLAGLKRGVDNTIGDSSFLYIEGDIPLVEIRFFNFYHHQLAKMFEAAITMRLGEALDSRGKAYSNIAALMMDLEDQPAETIVRVKGVLQSAYIETLKKEKSKVAPLNLSSLTMWTSSVEYWGHRRSKVTCSYFTRMLPKTLRESLADGWMLTGDLELTDDVWSEFYRHYSSEMSRCLVLNVPHHCSAISLGPKAADLVIGRMLLAACVPAHSDTHPSPTFIDLLACHNSGAIPITEEGHATLSMMTSWF